jgi:DNA-binding NarL/FixJ family response regulator
LLAARHYQDGGRVLPCAQAFEAAGTLLAPDDAERARTALSTAHALYTRLGAARDLSRLRDTLRRHRIRRAPRVPSTPATGWGGLTPAERSVADLVAEGLTNRQIAQRLYLSHRTVQSHVAKVLAKLGLQNRAEVAREAVRRDTNGSAR